MSLTQVPYDKAMEGLARLKSWVGITYGHDEVAPGTTMPADIDCSETAERIYKDCLGVPLPDGSMYQLKYCREHGEQIRYPEDQLRSFDLVFLTPPLDPVTGKPDWTKMGHVAIVVGVLDPSQAGGIMLIEARGGKWGKVIYTPLDTFVKQFRPRFAGVFRLVEILPATA